MTIIKLSGGCYIWEENSDDWLWQDALNQQRVYCGICSSWIEVGTLLIGCFNALWRLILAGDPWLKYDFSFSFKWTTLGSWNFLILDLYGDDSAAFSSHLISLTLLLQVSKSSNTTLIQGVQYLELKRSKSSLEICKNSDFIFWKKQKSGEVTTWSGSMMEVLARQ